MRNEEIIMLIISFAVVIEIIANLKYIYRINSILLILGSFMFFVLAGTATVTEDYLFPVILNYVEHLAYLAGVIMLALWSVIVYSKNRGQSR